MNEPVNIGTWEREPEDMDLADIVSEIAVLRKQLGVVGCVSLSGSDDELRDSLTALRAIRDQRARDSNAVAAKLWADSQRALDEEREAYAVAWRAECERVRAQRNRYFFVMVVTAIFLAAAVVALWGK